ncbi:ER lumen protein retaining receptor [Fimicolochytrium jonesii]|uniref:ER lumen protein retaining receptor n=1 Tax=Fimicolochytrium jonesii TaxID=1396493 RepID=UPI0022FEC6FA|nr:ER lumen protein retaining receptor [Fimicolochytrium jonesii]KAI8823518.1 ER lumen protein retaining receptor [Fimicolochytrium jonesii]
MNIFRLVADLMHLASIVILLLKITQTRSAAGISFKTQALYALIFCTRYLDLFVKFVSLYNTVMKLFFIGTSFYILYLMKVKYRATWDSTHDTLRVEYLMGPCAVLGLIFHEGGPFNIIEILWSFSIFLESVAILPQLFQLTRTGEAETITTHYLFALGAYRGLYILNWIYRYFTDGHVDYVAVISGILQTALYCDFFYVYFGRVLKGKKFKLPA